MINGEIARLTMSYNIANSSTAQNVFYYQLEDGPVPDEDVLDALQNFTFSVWGADWGDSATTDASLVLCEVSIVNADDEVVRIIGAVSDTVTGASLGDVLPAAVSLLLTAPTLVPRATGRKYVPGFGEGAVEDGAFTTAFLTAQADLLANYLTDIFVEVFGGTLIPGIISEITEGFIPFLGEGTMTDIPAYQRRRKPNVGI